MERLDEVQVLAADADAVLLSQFPVDDVLRTLVAGVVQTALVAANSAEFAVFGPSVEIEVALRTVTQLVAPKESWVLASETNIAIRAHFAGWSASDALI